MASEMSRRRATGALASLGLAACASPGGDDPHIERLLRRARSEHDLPGLAAAVVRGTSVDAIGVDGVRQIGTTEQIELTDRFHIASCTKSMTATLAAIAVDQGHIEWSTTLAEIQLASLHPQDAGAGGTSKLGELQTVGGAAG